MSRNSKLEFEKEESHYQCPSTMNREEPVLLEPEIYVNITHAKKEAQPSTGLSREKNTTGTANTVEGAADVTPTPAVLSHHRSMEILKTYIKAEPVTKEHGNAASSNSDTESDSSDFTPTSSPHHTMEILKSNKPVTEDHRNATSSKKERRGSRNKCLLFSIVVFCVLVIFLVFILLLTLIGLNRSELEKNQAEDSNLTATNINKQVRDLEESLSQINEVIQSLSTRLATAENTHNRINSLQDMVNTYRNRADSQISQLQNGINLESRCRKNSVSCDVNGNTRVYQLSCSTQNISMTTGVSHLLACSPSIHSIPFLFRFTTMPSVSIASSRRTVTLCQL